MPPEDTDVDANEVVDLLEALQASSTPPRATRRATPATSRSSGRGRPATARSRRHEEDRNQEVGDQEVRREEDHDQEVGNQEVDEQEDREQEDRGEDGVREESTQGVLTTQVRPEG